MNNINKNIWNNRLEKCMKDSNYSNQTQLANAINQKYGTRFSQKRISQWMNLGSEKNELKGFPEFENMMILADFFNVSISFLIGESDYEDITNEKIGKELGLSEHSIVSIKKMTNYNSTSSMMKQEHAQNFTNILNKLFVAEKFNELIYNLSELSRQYAKEESNREHLLEICNTVEESIFSEAMKIYQGKYRYEDYNLSEDLINTIELIDSTITNNFIIDSQQEYYSNAFKFKVQHTIYQLIEELFPVKLIK